MVKSNPIMLRLMATNRNKSCCQVAPSIISDSAQEKSFITEENSFVTDSMLYMYIVQRTLLLYENYRKYD